MITLNKQDKMFVLPLMPYIDKATKTITLPEEYCGEEYWFDYLKILGEDTSTKSCQAMSKKLYKKLCYSLKKLSFLRSTFLVDGVEITGEQAIANSSNPQATINSLKKCLIRQAYKIDPAQLAAHKILNLRINTGKFHKPRAVESNTKRDFQIWIKLSENAEVVRDGNTITVESTNNKWVVYCVCKTDTEAAAEMTILRKNGIRCNLHWPEEEKVIKVKKEKPQKLGILDWEL